MPDDPLEAARTALAAAGIHPSEDDMQRMSIFVLAGARSAEEAGPPRLETEPQLVQVMRRWPRT